MYLGRAWSLLLSHPTPNKAEREQRLSNSSLGYRKAIIIATAAATGQKMTLEACRSVNKFRLAYQDYLERLGRYREAALILQEALELDREDARCWWELGRMMKAWALLGNEDNDRAGLSDSRPSTIDRVERMRHACEAYDRACELEPKHELMRTSAEEARLTLKQLDESTSKDNTPSTTLVGSTPKQAISDFKVEPQATVNESQKTDSQNNLQVTQEPQSEDRLEKDTQQENDVRPPEVANETTTPVVVWVRELVHEPKESHSPAANTMQANQPSCDLKKLTPDMLVIPDFASLRRRRLEELQKPMDGAKQGTVPEPTKQDQKTISLPTQQLQSCHLSDQAGPIAETFPETGVVHENTDIEQAHTPTTSANTRPSPDGHSDVAVFSPSCSPKADETLQHNLEHKQDRSPLISHQLKSVGFNVSSRISVSRHPPLILTDHWTK